MDRVRVVLLTPLLIEERQREATRFALGNEAVLAPGLGAVLGARLGSFLVRLGRRLEALERRRASTVPLSAMGHAGGRGH